MHIVAISGSLREVSSNTALVQAAVMLAPPGTRVTLYRGLNDLPHFNPDLDVEPLPDAVRRLRESIGSADALLISSPEYAHGIPGTLKNALDWLVSGVEAVGLPVALLNASPRATHAQAALVEVLTTMSADIVPAARVTVPLAGRNLDAAAIASDPGLSAMVRTAFAALAAAVETRMRVHAGGEA